MTQRESVEIQEVQAQVQESIGRARDLISEARMTLGPPQPQQAQSPADEE